MEYRYQLKQPNDDYKEAIIEKSGITADFTLAQIEASQEHNRKARLEVEGNLTIRRAEMENVKNNHPKVLELTPVELTGAWLYKEASDYVEKAEAKLIEIDAAIAENDATIATVMETLGFQPAVDPTL